MCWLIRCESTGVTNVARLCCARLFANRGRKPGLRFKPRSRRGSMAVAKSRKSPSRRGMRRSHDALDKVQLATDPTSGEIHRRHHITKDGYYRGRKVIEDKQAVVDED